MHRHDGTSPSPARRTLALGGLGLTSALLLSGCGDVRTGYLPHSVTEHGETVTSFWNGMWIAALGVGALVWGLTAYCIVRFRRRPGDGLPEQIRYNVPLEILYTVVPIFMVGTIFLLNERVATDLLDTSEEPDNVVNVVGKQWSWDFNYMDEDVHEVGVQANLTGKPGVPETLPTMYLPVNERTEFVLTTRDVIHSFWVPQFLQKLDMMPGHVNRFQVVPTETGTFQGKCAELCGSYHSEMLFQVKVVERAEYDRYIEGLRKKGQTGILNDAYSREELVPEERGDDFGHENSNDREIGNEN